MGSQPIECRTCEFKPECEMEFLQDNWTFCPRSGMPIGVMCGIEEDQSDGRSDVQQGRAQAD